MMEPPLGLASKAVVVVAYDGRWPRLFEDERNRLAGALVPLGARVEHIGSTAVPGLASKPVLDILVGRPEGSALASFVTVLAPLGYQHRGEQDVAGRELFRRGDPRSHHLHLVVANQPLWRSYLAFRDALRADRRLLQEYARLKIELATRHPTDREAYVKGKAAFIARVLGAAESRTVEIPIDGTLDLHTFRPGEVAEILSEYLEVCAMRGIREVRVVHGKGIGVLRNTVEAVLTRSPRVARFATADESAGGWGATLVTLNIPGK
jgi:GrpB-like predicted nucleotidyltransferase (UPF0157 family)